MKKNSSQANRGGREERRRKGLDEKQRGGVFARLIKQKRLNGGMEEERIELKREIHGQKKGGKWSG